MRALILENLKRFEEALAAYDEAIAVAPGAIEPLYNRGNVFADLARFEEALASYDQALAINADAPVVLNNRGLVLEELNRLGSIREFEKALKIKPGYEAAVENRQLLLGNSIIAYFSIKEISYSDRRRSRELPKYKRNLSEGHYCR